jgi:hypothetical protein
VVRVVVARVVRRVEARMVMVCVSENLSVLGDWCCSVALGWSWWM